ncbi:hypothetical protein H920_14495 [Fukomys damarensis]|uniref:Uncharacterized protein n=1 Tax=Fukomys damarensis TaxID=885580 RepID=A0A091D0R7_FUKDA|nr:hypothetical protein H920_14495 [Fukomys damarensis]
MTFSLGLQCSVLTVTMETVEEALIILK